MIAAALIYIGVLVVLGWWTLTKGSCRWCGREDCDTCGPGRL